MKAKEIIKRWNEEVNGKQVNDMKIKLESKKYYNAEKKWILTEERVFCDDEMLEVYLQVYDVTTMEIVEDEVIEDDVWSIDWKLIDSNM